MGFKTFFGCAFTVEPKKIGFDSAYFFRTLFSPNPYIYTTFQDVYVDIFIGVFGIFNLKHRYRDSTLFTTTLVKTKLRQIGRK